MRLLTSVGLVWVPVLVLSGSVPMSLGALLSLLVRDFGFSWPFARSAHALCCRFGTEGMAVFGCSWPFPRSVYGLAMCCSWPPQLSLWLLLAILGSALPRDVSLLDFAGYLSRLLLALHKKCSGLAMLLPLDSAGLWFSAALGRVQEVLFRDAVAPGLRGQFVHVSRLVWFNGVTYLRSTCDPRG